MVTQITRTHGVSCLRFHHEDLKLFLRERAAHTDTRRSTTNAAIGSRQNDICRRTFRGESSGLKDPHAGINKRRYIPGHGGANFHAVKFHRAGVVTCDVVPADAKTQLALLLRPAITHTGYFNHCKISPAIKMAAD